MMASYVDFKPGLRVRVMNRTLGGKDVVEGMATIRKINQGDKGGVHAEVEFDDDPGRTFERWVFAHDQDDALEFAK
jgi:hypothetical protein